MTVPTKTSVWSYVGNGVATTFAYTSKILRSSDLVVTRTVIATKVDTLLVLDTDYTVTGVGDDGGGNVVYAPTPIMPATEKLTIQRIVPQLQNVDLRNQSTFQPEVVEDALDELTMSDLQLDDELKRTARAPVTDLTVIDMALRTAINGVDPVNPLDLATRGWVLANILSPGIDSVANVNVAALANIALTKLADISANVAAYQATVDPGDVGTESLPTDLKGELERLRFVLDAIIGGAEWYTDPASTLAALNTLTVAHTASLLDLTGGRNILGNAGFDYGTLSDTVVPTLWTALGAATFSLDVAEVGEGDGFEITLTAVAGANADGLTQTLQGLKALTTYVVTCRVRSTLATTSGRIITTGGSGTQLALTFDGAGGADGTGYVTKTGIFITDSTPAAVTLRVDLDQATDVVSLDNFSVVELQADRKLPGGSIVDRVSGNTLVAVQFVTGSWTTWDVGGGTNARVDVKVPGPGYRLKVRAEMRGEANAVQNLGVRLRMSIDGAAATTEDFVHQHLDAAAVGIHLALGFDLDNPVPGSKYEFTVEGRVSASTVDLQENTIIGGGENSRSWIIVELIPYG